MEKLLHTRKFKIINRCVLPVSALGIATLSGSIQMFCCCCKLFNEHHWIVLKHVIAISSRGDFFLKSALNITTVYFVLITTVVLKCWFEVKEAVLRFRLARVHIQVSHGGGRGASWRRMSRPIGSAHLAGEFTWHLLVSRWSFLSPGNSGYEASPLEWWDVAPLGNEGA